jgi:hypothetical protein
MNHPLLKAVWPQAKGQDVAALGSIILFFIAFFPQGLFGGRYLLAGDNFFYSYPMHTVAWQMLRHGQLPLWSPYTLSGYPLLSMAQLGLGYPLTWGHLFLPGYIAEQIYVLAPFLLVPMFTYFYVRSLGRSPLAALLAGLSFGYGGMMASPLGNSGMMTNAALWLPLFLLALEWARIRSFLPCLLLATGAYTMSVLNGFGQGFVYVGLLALAYALFIVLAAKREDGLKTNSPLQTWRPVLVACGAGLLAAGVAAFQILETGRMVRRSVRSKLSFEAFTQGSFTPQTLWKSLEVPLFYVIDMHAYLPPLAIALGLAAIWGHSRSKSYRDSRVFFYFGLAVFALLLMLGEHTPLYRFIYHLPVVNLFRVPSRHTLEWTFAVSMLAAYGWDLVVKSLREWRETRLHSRSLYVYITFALLAASITAGALWWLKVQAIPDGYIGQQASEATYRFWKAVFVTVTLVTLLAGSFIKQPRVRFGLLLTSVLVICYFEPAGLISRWWGSGFDATRFGAISDATRYLQQFPPEQGRVYTRVDLMTEQYGSPPRFDAPNLSAISGLHNVAGYEPLILERYSRALGNVGLDSVRSRSNGEVDQSLFEARSHVLDILNTNFVVSYSNLDTSLGWPNETSASSHVPGEVMPGTTMRLSTKPAVADALELVTSLSNSTMEPDGQIVARVRIFAVDRPNIERELEAGRDTAEWAHERSDVRPFIKHKLAPISAETQIGGLDGYKAYRYKAVLRFAEPLRVTRVEVENLSDTAPLGIYSATLTSSTSQTNTPLVNLYSEAWRPIYEQNSLLILRNSRALPRAWLVAEAEAVDGEEALARIRGEGGRGFDPRRTALLEISPADLPHLPGGELAPESVARITSYEPSRLVIETSAPTSTVLMLSEIFYPGWEATVDGRGAEIHLADFLLRGVALPSGHHTVEMRYTATAARNGAIVSALTLCLIAGLAIYAGRHLLGIGNAKWQRGDLMRKNGRRT